MVLSLICSVFLWARAPRIVEASSCIQTSAKPFFNLIRSSQPSAHLLQTVFISKFFLGSALSSAERMHSLRTLLNPPWSSEVRRSFYSLTTCNPFLAFYDFPSPAGTDLRLRATKQFYSLKRLPLDRNRRRVRRRLPWLIEFDVRSQPSGIRVRH